MYKVVKPIVKKTRILYSSNLFSNNTAVEKQISDDLKVNRHHAEESRSASVDNTYPILRLWSHLLHQLLVTKVSKTSKYP